MRKFLLIAALLATAAFLAPSVDAQPLSTGKVQFVGKTKNGKFGVLSANEALDWLTEKAPGRAKQIRSNASTCVSDVLSGKGKAAAGYKHQELPVFHVSHGAGNTGCTVFYVLKHGGRVQPVKVVAVGRRIGPTTYALDWRERDCPLPERVDLSHETDDKKGASGARGKTPRTEVQKD